jgi:triosephosphate isomerase
MKFPTIMINFKTYDQAAGYDAEEIVKICKEVMDETGKSISCCPQAPDLYRCSQYKIPILAQHENTELPGGHTGKITIKSIKENGCDGSLINHSENRITYEKINELIHLLRQSDLISIVCVRDVYEASAVAKLHPDVIAIEPPELIGGDISVTNANPDIIKDSVNAVHEISEDIIVLCGAGVKTGEDVKKAIELGASGVLIASGVTKAKDKKQAIMNLVKGL